MTRPYFDPVASGSRMRYVRKSRKLSAEQVREYMGFESVQSIYKWERGECYPQADTLIALCMLYQVNPMELFEETQKVSLIILNLKCNQRFTDICKSGRYNEEEVRHEVNTSRCNLIVTKV